MSNISFDDFKKLDIRIGEVVEAKVPDWSHWVMKLTVDFGDPPAGGGQRIIFAGIMHFYKPEDLIGKQFPFLVNIEPRKIGPEGDMSEGMMLAADGKLDKPIQVENEEILEKPVLLIPSEKLSNGAKIR